MLEEFEEAETEVSFGAETQTPGPPQVPIYLGTVISFRFADQRVGDWGPCKIHRFFLERPERTGHGRQSFPQKDDCFLLSCKASIREKM